MRAFFRRFYWLLLLQISALFGVGIYVLYRVIVTGQQLDMLHYHAVAEALMRGELPYRDFLLEYPPLSVVAFVLPKFLIFGSSSFTLYAWAFLGQAGLASALLGIWLVRLTSRWSFPMRAQASLTLYVTLVISGAFLLPWRYDLFPVLLTAVAFEFILRRRPGACGFFLGLGTAAKLYPLVLVPIFGLYLLCQNMRRDFYRMLFGGAIALILCILPFLILSPASLLNFIHYHQQRGFEIGSLGAGLGALAHVLGWSIARYDFVFGGLQLEAPWTVRALPWVTGAMPGLFLIVILRCAFVFKQSWLKEKLIPPYELARFTVIALLLFMIGNKVLSPQYLFWLLPFAPLLTRKQAWQIFALFALTTLIYPLLFAQLQRFEPIAVVILNLRNFGMLLTLVAMLSLRASDSGQNFRLVRTNPVPN